MRKIHTGLIITIMVSVFLVSFLIGRATALKDNDGEIQNNINNGALTSSKEKKEDSIETSQKSEKVAKNTDNKEQEKTPDVSTIERMIYPVGKNVQKNYSQIAIYSETMGDWRAHTGIDYGAALGDTVVSVYDGKVSKIYKDKLWGYTVEITHSNNLKSVYKNLAAKIPIKEGQAVKQGQAIGAVGRSADIECLEKPHLHFEIWQDDVAINPESYVY